MNVNDNSTTIKILIDVVSDKLQVLSDKINNYHSLVNGSLTTSTANISDQTKQINDIVYEIKTINKTLSENLDNFYDRTDKLLENTKDTNTSCGNITKKIDGVQNSLIDFKREMQPLLKFVQFMSKPLGFLFILISLIIASYTIVTSVQSVVEKLSDTIAPPVQSIELTKPTDKSN